MAIPTEPDIPNSSINAFQGKRDRKDIFRAFFVCSKVYIIPTNPEQTAAIAGPIKPKAFINAMFRNMLATKAAIELSKIGLVFPTA